MATIEGNLWAFNLVRVRVVDVSDDYRLMQPPLPSTYYPVIKEIWLPRMQLPAAIGKLDLMPGYLYDWHEFPSEETGDWYVGVVDEALTHGPHLQVQTPMTS